MDSLSFHLVQKGPVRSGIIEAVIGKIKGVIPKEVPLSLPESLGGAADDLQSFLLKKLAGGDKVLFRGSAKLKDRKKGKKYFDIKGCGTDGAYQIDFSLAQTDKEKKDNSP